MSTNFIYKKKKALSKFYCDELINYFEENKSKWESGCVYDDGVKTSRAHKNSIDLPIKMHDPSNPILTTLEIVLSNNLREYGKEHVFLTKLDPHAVDIDANIQKYYRTGAYSTEHCEYGINKFSNKRVLAWMFYLNNVTDKGGTRFPQQNITLKARAGDLYIWPAYFTHSHYGIASPTQIKYIATGWVSFNIDPKRKDAID